MNLGISEVLIVLVNLICILAIPAIVIIAAVLLLRRLRDLETRLAKLESGQAALVEPAEKES
jgi:uncharacterized membrane protein YhaH (DUF805 family)